MTSKLIAVVAIAVVLMMSGTVNAAEFTGSWKGTLTGAGDSAAEVQIEFSAQGFPLYSYTNNKRVARQVELSHVGQTVEYVPAGGGVQRVVVKTLEQGRGRLSVGLRLFATETGIGLVRVCACSEGLQLRITTQASHFSDKNMIVGGNPRRPSSRVSYRGCVDPRFVLMATPSPVQTIRVQCMHEYSSTIYSR